MTHHLLMSSRLLPCCAAVAKPAADINGTWRLVFSTATSNRLLQYIPVQEDFVIQLDKQYCALDSEVGPLRFIISGNITGWEPTTGAMDFQFTAVDIQVFGNKVRRAYNCDR